MRNKLHQVFINSKIRIFLFFLMISLGSLILNKLTKEYIITIPYKVMVTKLPANKILLKQPEEMVNITIKATGFNVIGYQILHRKIKIDATKATFVKGTSYLLETNLLKDEIQKQLLFNTEMVEIIDKTIVFEMGKMVTKKIPIILNSNIIFENGYKFKSALKLLPDSIRIFGPEDKIAKINYVKTLPLNLKNINADFEEVVDLKFTQEFKTVSMHDKKVIVIATVDKFTELTFIVPFKIINNHQKLQIESFPSKVKMVFQIALSEIPKINENSFELVCDLEKTRKLQLNYLIPELINKPSSVHNYHIEPTKIDFIIKN